MSDVDPAEQHSGWRGRRVRSALAPRYRWQRDPSAETRDPLRSHNLGRRLQVGGLLLLALLLAAVLAYRLSFDPPRATFLAISAPAYSWPFPPLAWSSEELAGFQGLDKENLQVFDLSAAWESKERGLAQLNERLDEVVAGGGLEPLVIYIAMHGAVDGAGEPCLAPAGATPLKTDSWLQLKELFALIKSRHLPDERPKLLLLDCSRLQVNWNLGIVLNTFADSLAKAVQEAQLPGLVVINSTGSGEKGWSSDDLASSVFGYYLRLGLAGAADADHESGGNGDRRVSLRELHRYLRKHVDEWAMFNRNSHERPLLIPSDAADFTITWSFTKSALRKLEAAAADSAPTLPAPAPAASVDLWRKHDELRVRRAYQNDPIGYRNFEQKLIWLSQAQRAGKTYLAASQRVEADLASTFAALERRLRPTFVGRGDAAPSAGSGDRKPEPPIAHSIPLGRFLGVIGPETAGKLNGALDAFRQSPSKESGLAVVERLASPRLAGLVEAQTMRLFERYLSDDAWREPASVARVVGLRQLAEATACPVDARVQFWIRARVDAADMVRREAEDRLFVGDRADLDSLASDASRAEEQYGLAAALSKSSATALALHDQAATELPYLAAWLGRPAPGKHAAAAADQEINHTLLRLIDANRRLGVALSSAYAEQESIAPDSTPWDSAKVDVERMLGAVHGNMRAEIARLQDARAAKAVTVGSLESALTLPMLTVSERESLSRQFVRFASRLHGDFFDPKRNQVSKRSEKSKDAGDRELADSDEHASPKPAPSKADRSKEQSEEKAKAAKDASSTEELFGDDGYLERIAIRWDEHPAIAILRRNDNSAASDRRRAGAGADLTNTVNHDGQHLRELLASLASDVRSWQVRQRLTDNIQPNEAPPAAPAPVSAAAPGSAAAIVLGSARPAAAPAKPLSASAILQAREEWSAPARWVRQAASFSFPTLDVDPIERLQRFDAQQVLLWQAQRALDDFLGPVDNQADPFFVVAARDELALARQLGDSAGIVGEELERLENLLIQRRRAARAGLETAATDIVLTGGAGDIPIGLQVKPGLDNTAAGLPPALAAVYLDDTRGRIVGATFALQLPLGSVGVSDANVAPPPPTGAGAGEPTLGEPAPARPLPPPLPNASERQSPAPREAAPISPPPEPSPPPAPLELPAPKSSTVAPPRLNPPPDARRASAVEPAPNGDRLIASKPNDVMLAGFKSNGHDLSPAASPSWIRRFEAPEEHFEGRGPLLDATTLVRGNRFSTKVLLRPTGGVKIDFTRYEYGPPSVSVLGRNRRRVAIEFILDCSHSMEELTPVEAPGAKQRAPRLELAKAALEGMLDELAVRGDAKVGVRFFGHRIGWNIKQPNQLLRQSDYGRPSQDGLLPSEDVELVLPLGRYDTVINRGMIDLMKTVKPWGETPLYLALIQALGDFAHEDEDTERSIIVITDGVNYQFNSPNPRTRQQVLTAYNAAPRKVPIHIVGFGINEKETVEATREFGEIAKWTQGSYVPVTSATALVRSLEALLGSKPFRVYDSLDREIGEAPVGSTIRLDAARGQIENFSVRLDRIAATIELQGGEAVELAPSRDGRRLESIPYDKNSPTFAPLVMGAGGSSMAAGGVSTGIELGAHRALWQAEGVRFPFSFQHIDHAFTARPAEVWLEVAPLMAEKRLGGSTRRASALATTAMAKSQKYIFYDVNYAPATSAPVLDWLAADWPVEARQAEIRVWAKPNLTPPNWRSSLAKLVDPAEMSIGGRTLEGFAGVSYQVRAKRAGAGQPRQIAIVERHAEDGPPLDALKFELFPPAHHTIHRYDMEHRIVVHIFSLGGESLRSLADYELLVTRREDLHSGAWRLEEPMVIDVAEPGDLIRLGPAAAVSP